MTPMAVERKLITAISRLSSGGMTLVRTIHGDGIDVPTFAIPADAYENPNKFYLESTWKNAKGTPAHRVISVEDAEKLDETDKRKQLSLMRIIEKLIIRHHQGLIALDDPSFKLFELAKRIHWAENEQQFQSVLADLKNFNE